MQIKNIIHRHNYQITAPHTYRRTDVVRLTNGNTIVYVTNYNNNKPVDKLVRVFNALGEWTKSKYKILKKI